ncbi:MAG: RNA polymerase sigma factor, partial [Myxococcota bacterium]
MTESEDIEALYARSFAIVQAKCRRILGNSDAANDVAQETFMRLWAKRKSIRDPDALLSWVYTTATRLSIENLRKSRREPLGVDPDEPTFDTSPEAIATSRLTL